MTTVLKGQEICLGSTAEGFHYFLCGVLSCLDFEMKYLLFQKLISSIAVVHRYVSSYKRS